MLLHKFFKSPGPELHWWCSGKKPCANAGDVGSILGWGRSHIGHNYWARVSQLLKPLHLEPALWKKRSPCSAVKSSTCSPGLEKTRAQQGRYQWANEQTEPRPKQRLKKTLPFLGLRIISTPWFPQLSKRIKQLDVLHIAIVRFPCVHGLENFLKPQNQP